MLKKTARLTALVVVVFAMQGCAVAALVAAASWAGKNGENTRMEFQRLNMDRQEKGLAPLTWEDFKKGRTPGNAELAEGGYPLALESAP